MKSIPLRAIERTPGVGNFRTLIMVPGERPVSAYTSHSAGDFRMIPFEYPLSPKGDARGAPNQEVCAAASGQERTKESPAKKAGPSTVEVIPWPQSSLSSPAGVIKHTVPVTLLLKSVEMSEVLTVPEIKRSPVACSNLPVPPTTRFTSVNT